MLERRLEAEVMDTPEEAAVYDAMDHATVNIQFVDDLLDLNLAEGEILDLGTGSARIPIELCRRSDQARVVAVDLSASMLDVARINLELAELTDRVMLDLIDAKRLPYAEGRFALAISNSIVHHIPDPRQVISEAIRVTAENGLLFFRDLMRPDTAEELNALVETYAGDESGEARDMFDDSLHASLSLSEMRSLVQSLGCDEETVQATSDRHWTWVAQRSQICP